MREGRGAVKAVVVETVERRANVANFIVVLIIELSVLLHKCCSS